MNELHLRVHGAVFPRNFTPPDVDLLFRIPRSLDISRVLSVLAQQWELVTPPKTRSELVGLYMNSALTGYVVDRPMRSVLKTSNAGADRERKANNRNSTPNAIWMCDDQRGHSRGE